MADDERKFLKRSLCQNLTQSSVTAFQSKIKTKTKTNLGYCMYLFGSGSMLDKNTQHSDDVLPK